MKNEALNAFSSLRFHLEENGAKYFQLSSLMRFQKYLFSVSSDNVSVFTSMRFHLIHARNDAMRFQKAPLLKPFSKVFVFIRVFGCFSVDERRKRIEMYAFSNEDTLVWMGSMGPYKAPAVLTLLTYVTCHDRADKLQQL